MILLNLVKIHAQFEPRCYVLAKINQDCCVIQISIFYLFNRVVSIFNNTAFKSLHIQINVQMMYEILFE